MLSLRIPQLLASNSVVFGSIYYIVYKVEESRGIITPVFS